jgi:hypothetical protein
MSFARCGLFLRTPLRQVVADYTAAAPHNCMVL